MAAVIYTVDGREVVLEAPTLKDLQDAVGGYITMVPSTIFRDARKGKVMLVNEDGEAQQLRHNPKATVLCGGYPILGDVVVMDQETFAKAV